MKMGDVQDEVLRYWLKMCPSNGGVYPSRQDLRVSDLRGRMAHIAILDIETDPVDFRYRLIGTRLCEFLFRDYTGEKLSDLDGKGPDSEIWGIFDRVRRSGDPLYCEIPYVGPKSDFKQASGLYLPLASDHKNIDKIMQVSHFQRMEPDHQAFDFSWMESRIYAVPTN